MSIGAQRVDAQQPDTGVSGNGEGDWAAIPLSGNRVHEAPWTRPEDEETEGSGSRIGPLLTVAALAWLGLSGWTALRGGVTLEGAVQWLALASGPLALLGLAWFAFGQRRQEESDRLPRALGQMRAEASALDSVIEQVAAKLESQHGRMNDEADKLMALGDEASDRLGRVAHFLSKEGVKLDGRTQALQSAAEAVRGELELLMNDLPKAEERAKAVAGQMKEAGLSAHEQAGALEGQLAALAARAREADEVVGGAAGRLGAHLSRVESTTEAASARLGEASAAMAESIDGSMARAAEALDAARSSLETQGRAMLAMVEQSRAALNEAGEDAARQLGRRLETIGGKIEAVAAQLAAQDASSKALIASIDQEIGVLESRIGALGERGRGTSEELKLALGGMREALLQVDEEVGAGSERAAALTARALQIAEAVASIGAQLGGEVPQALERIEEQAERARGSVASIAPEVAGISAAAEESAGKLTDAGARLTEQQKALEATLARLGEGIGKAEAQVRALTEATHEADGAAGRIVSETGPELIDALVRVREAGAQAAERAREAIQAVIPQSAAALGEASRQAVNEAVTAEVERQLVELGTVAERSLDAAKRASERLTKQLLTIGETAAAVEDRIEEGRKEQEAKEGFSRRVALLIESLNSTAIDVTKILSNDVTDSAWAAYLKGDRGVFTRRAVRLLDQSDAREIMTHYDSDPEFRDQVNRYIHDFEAMLRRILADRDSSALGVTILSSDMGKLYVALAQAIERIRA
jgi:hypothetical protein